jgi:phosphonate transport system substrate-binding protein
MSFRFGISQVHGGATVIEGARAFTRALGTLMGRTARLHVADDYEALQRIVRAGGVDLAWLPPFLHMEAARSGAQLLAVCERAGALTYRSSIVVRADDPVRGLEELSAARVAWTDPSSASGYIFPRLHLIAGGVDPKRAFADEAFYGSPREVCAAVADGLADLGACFTSEEHAADRKLALADVARIYPAATWRLRVLAVTDSIPSDGMVLGAHVEADVRARVTDALLRMRNIPDGEEGLAKLLFAERLVAVNEHVARAIERLMPLIRAAQ